MNKKEIFLTVALLLSASGYVVTFINNDVKNNTKKEDRVYTLYRNTAFDKSSRVHVGTFDADDSVIYNQSMCEKTKNLMLTEPDLADRYWCEPGYFRKISP